MTTNQYDKHLEKTAANYTPLTPISLIQRTAMVYPDHLAIIDGAKETTWAECYERCLRLASALSKRGLKYGDTVAIMAPNISAIFEAHFGVPMSGAVLNTLNTRLDADTLAFTLEHSGARVLLTDIEYSQVIKEALKKVKSKPLVVDIVDAGIDGERLGEMDYEEFLSTGDANFQAKLPADEWQAISLNYTSGTTGKPKGVVYHHRGAYLNALSNIIGWNMGHHPRYLWTLPMFHCNGWCFPWTLAAVAGTSICLRRVNAAGIYKAIAEQKASHFCGAPIVLNFVINATNDEKLEFDHQVEVMTAAAPPPASVLAAMEKSGFHMTHVYGLTETYGPAVICAWKNQWDRLEDETRAQKKSRQGVPYHVLQDLQVMDPETMLPVPADGETIGEVMFRGNIVMKGYLKNPGGTDDALADGWFHSGDLGVMHPDNYLQIKDRSKDIIISGGENISSIEVEDALYKHPAVLEAAVVARPDDKWGETPCAFVTLKVSINDIKAEDLITFCRQHLAAYKIPRSVVFTDLPKTSTGKVQKFKLREQALAMGSLN